MYYFFYLTSLIINICKKNNNLPTVQQDIVKFEKNKINENNDDYDFFVYFDE
jgi:hypothetical protein